MGAFEFQALDAKGRAKKGTVEADSARQVRQQLRAKGLMPIAVEPTIEKAIKGSKAPAGGKGKLNAADLALVTRQMATLIQSGIPIEETLSAVADQNDNPKIRRMMVAIRSKVLEGFTLADSLAEYPSAFPHLYRSTVAAGEHAGHLDLVLNRLADYTEARQASRQNIQLAAVYPVLLTFVSIGIVVFLLTYVVPDIVEVFANSGQQLPVLTQVMIGLSEFLKQSWYWLLGLIVFAVVGFNYALKKDGFRMRFHQRLLETPFIAKFSRGMNTARFASTLSILTSSGVPLVDAMRISADVLANDYLKRGLKESAQMVSEGSSLKKSLDQNGYFPPMMLHMIASGEASGELDQMLERTARNQENELEALIKTLVGLFEPIMLLFMGGVVMLIVLAIMLPILSLSSLV